MVPPNSDRFALEYHAARSSVGMADLSSHGFLLISGKDRFSFLQNIISNDLSLCTDTQGIYTTLLTGKGKIRADFSLYAVGDALSGATTQGRPYTDGFVADCAFCEAASVLKHLIYYKLRSQVCIEPLPWRKMLITGPLARTLLETLLQGPIPPMTVRSRLIKIWNDTPLICIREWITAGEDYQLCVPATAWNVLWERCLEIGQALDGQVFGPSLLETLRIEAGRPRYGAELTEEIMPPEAGIETEAISYTKGCFPGQEVMARIKTYGHVNKRLFGIQFSREVELTESGFPQGGDRVFHEGQDAGFVASATWSPFVGYVVALGYLKLAVARTGTDLTVAVGNGLQAKAQAISLPIYHPPLLPVVQAHV